MAHYHDEHENEYDLRQSLRSLAMPSTDRTYAGRPMEFDFDRDLEPGKALAVGADGIQVQIISVPQEMPPSWAVKVTLSIEDYGKLVLHHARNSSLGA